MFSISYVSNQEFEKKKKNTTNFAFAFLLRTREGLAAFQQQSHRIVNRQSSITNREGR